MRVHLGCAGTMLEGWVNVDADPRVAADVHADPFDFVARCGSDIGELYLGRLLESLCPDDAVALLRLIGARAPAGTGVTAAAVDVRAAAGALAGGEVDLDTFNRELVHAGGPGPGQRWSYDGPSLLEVFTRGGIKKVTQADLASLPDADALAGALGRFRCAASGSVGAAGRRAAVTPSHELPAPPPLAVSAQDTVLAELEAVRAELERLRRREEAALRRAGQADRFEHELHDTQNTLAQLTGSITFRVAQGGSRVARRILPAGTRRRDAVARLVRAVRSGPSTRDGS